MAAKTTTTPAKTQLKPHPKPQMKAQKISAKTPAAAKPAANAKAPMVKGAKALATMSIAAGAVTPTIQRNEGEAAAAAPMTPKNFRNHPDMENFFRFIYENDLRLEALQIIDEIIVNRAARRSSKKGSSAAATATA